VAFRVWPVRIAVVIFFNPHDHVTLSAPI